MNNTGVTILSVLIPTIPERDEQSKRLINEVWLQRASLNSWHPTLGNVEIKVDESKSFLNGGLSIGKKRQSLVRRAKGDYCCFLDDDEDIAPNYLETLMRLCQHDRDICTFRSLTKTDHYWTLVDMSLNYTHNDDASPNFIVRRRPFHICPVRTEFAKLYDFEDSNYGEDFNWMEKVLRHCANEAHTEAIIHSYIHSSKTSEADRITNHIKNVQPI